VLLSGAKLINYSDYAKKSWRQPSGKKQKKPGMFFSIFTEKARGLLFGI